LVIDDAAALLWITNLGCIELHPHAVLATDLDHPNELRIDLDPGPGVPWDHVRQVAMHVKTLLEECNLRGWVKTSGSRGMHVWVRIQPRWGFDDVRRAALALAREVERRAPGLATSKWWKEERKGVFLDYNQNAKDRTTCSVYSVRATIDARVSTPLHWEEVPTVDPALFTLRTVPKRLADLGDPHADIDRHAGELDALLDLAARDEGAGLGDAPWPPHYGKREGEAARVAPSRKKGARAPAPKKREKMPLVIIAKAQKKADALAGLERWKERHAAVVRYLAPEDILVDTMRGRYSPWFRIRINLKNVPEAERPPEEKPDPDEDASGWGAWGG
ncbi:MAG TPA: DNA primase small subunit domain-containing protein, partial [Polyangiaceae bacterium]|nr:DNA primase small subunit domain-containing protein [Polyangiaceae bacterium]